MVDFFLGKKEKKDSRIIPLQWKIQSEKRKNNFLLSSTHLNLTQKEKENTVHQTQDQMGLDKTEFLNTVQVSKPKSKLSSLSL